MTNDTKDDANNEFRKTMSEEDTDGPLDTNLIVLYDKFVIPRRKVTDYRTECSGITKKTYAKRGSQQ